MHSASHWPGSTAWAVMQLPAERIPGGPTLHPPLPSHCRRRRYTALLYRPTNLTTPIFSLALTASGTAASGTTSFTEELALPAGPYRLEIATANVYGAGGKSGMTANFTVGKAQKGARFYAARQARGTAWWCRRVEPPVKCPGRLTASVECPLPRRHLQHSRHQQRHR